MSKNIAPNESETGSDHAQPARSDTSGDRNSGPERDFGDSAGYGTGGSALDFHKVGDEDADPVKGKHNPLDDVMKDGEGGS